MVLRRGGQSVTRVMRGTTPVKRVYRGAVAVWSDRYTTSTSGPVAAATASNTWFTVFTHVVASPGGRGVITASGHWGWIYSNTSHDLAIVVNGTQVATAGTPANREAKFHTVTAAERLLLPGDTVQVQIRTNSTTTDGRSFTPVLTIA